MIKPDLCCLRPILSAHPGEHDPDLESTSSFEDHLTRLFRFTCLASIQNLTIDHVKKEAQQVLWDVEGFGVNRSKFVMFFRDLALLDKP